MWFFQRLVENQEIKTSSTEFPTEGVATDELNAATRELQSSALQKLIFATTGILFMWFFLIGQVSVELLLWRFWVVLVITILVIQVTIRLIPKNMTVANLTWTAGLFVINTAMIFILKNPQAAFFYALLPLQVVSLLGWRAGVISILFIAGMMILLSGIPFAAVIGPYILVIIAGAIISAFLGWVTSDTLLAEVRNSLYYFHLSRKNLEEAREHRGQLFKILKDLDLAYYRLERANAALVAAWKEAESAERAKSELVTFVSHEMRTPLNLIMGFSETILTAPESYGGVPLPGRYREDLNKINQNAQHLMALVNDVIDLARANVNRIHLTKEPIAIPEFIEETTAMVRDYVQSKRLELIIDLAPNLPILYADRLRVRQILLNLLVNAVRFTEKGSVSIIVRYRENAFKFCVADTGRGISENHLPYIFEEFHNGQAANDHSWHSGSGLGLPISKKLVELHRGKMGVESKVNQRTTFWFSLPDGCEETAEARSSAPGVKSPERLALRPFTIMPYQPREMERMLIVVHSDRRLVAVLQRMFEGYKLLPAASLAEGMKFAVENQAIGIVVREWPEEEPNPEHLLVIECDLPDTRQTARQLGVLDILEKPVSSVLLLETIDAVQPPVQKLLIVDDDVELVQLYQRVLFSRFDPQNCLSAYNGKEAIEFIHSHRPDLVLLDLRMPEVDGYQVIQAVRQDPSLASVRIILVSGTVQESTSTDIPGKIQFSVAGKWNISEAARLLEGALNAISPGWDA